MIQNSFRIISCQVSVSIKESERSNICVLRVSIVTLYALHVYLYWMLELFQQCGNFNFYVIM